MAEKTLTPCFYFPRYEIEKPEWYIFSSRLLAEGASDVLFPLSAPIAHLSQFVGCMPLAQGPFLYNNVQI